MKRATSLTSQKSHWTHVTKCAFQRTIVDDLEGGVDQQIHYMRYKSEKKEIQLRLILKLKSQVLKLNFWQNLLWLVVRQFLLFLDHSISFENSENIEQYHEQKMLKSICTVYFENNYMLDIKHSNFPKCKNVLAMQTVNV